MTSLEEISRVKVDNNKLIIKEFETTDNDVVNYFQSVESEKRDERLGTALKIGVVAIKTVGMTEKIDYIEKEFDNLNNNFSNTLENTIVELDKRYEDIFGEKGKFSEIIQQHFGENGKIVKDLFDPNKEGTPLCNLKNEFRKEIFELRQQIVAKEVKNELVQKTTLKGENFQDVCEDILSQFVHHYDDSLENATTKVGKLTNSKKGDFVLTLKENNKKKIVFEVKDTKSISLTEIQQTLDESIQNREASYGILVVKAVECLPKQVGWFHEIENNKLICALSSSEKAESRHYEMLLIACKWARARIMMQSLKENEINAEFVQTKISRIQNKLKELRNIKTQCTNIETSSDKIRTIAKQLEDDIGMEISEILGKITSKNP